MGSLPTIKVAAPDTPRGWKIINATDFDTDQHEEWTDGQEAVQQEEGPQEVTRETIGEMAKADVVEMLEAHGVEVNTRQRVETLREQLIALMFVDV